MADPGDNETEWIELFNAKSEEINLTGWRLEDGSKAKTNLSGSLGPSGASRYRVIDKPAGNLNNSGDIIILYDPSGKVIDQVVYGDWPDGNLDDNAPVGHDPTSTARKYDGYNTYNNANDFAVTMSPTKGASNVIQAEDEISAAAKANFDFANDIYISEILPNPVGDDTKLEFIEIFNAGTREVNLTGWSLSNETDKKINLEKAATSTIIKAGEYLAFFRPKTKIVLHNDQGEVKIFQPLAEKAWQTVKYKEVKEGWSYNANNPPNPPGINPGQALYQGGINWNWAWSETPTPGEANAIKVLNQPLEVEFSFPESILAGQPVVFDSSDTDNSSGGSLKYTWDFGDGFTNTLANPEHTYFKSGIYQVKLAVSDEQTTVEKEMRVKVLAEFENSDSTSPPPSPSQGEGEVQGGEVIINEVFPDPKGADTGQEWLELKNQGTDKINLINWRVENSNGKYKFKNDLWLGAENFYLLTNTQSNLALKNGSDVVSLYNSLDELADQVEYADAVQGEAYARGENGKWFWTTRLTPDQENIISLSGSQSVVSQKLGGVETANNYEEVTLAAVSDMEIGSLVKVNGVVAVEPGILGAQIFYIVSSSASASADAKAMADKEATADKSAGVQIYNYKKDFPALKIGDNVEIFGELAQTQTELRIKTKTKDDIKVKKQGTPPPALALSCDTVGEENVGQLISLTGEVTSKKSSTLYVDDGSGEILVYLKKAAGVDAKGLTPGQAIAVTGILSKTESGFRLMPRHQADIVLTSSANQLEPQVLGEKIEADGLAVAERDRKLELFKYLLIIAAGVIIVLVGLFIKITRKK